MQHAAALKRHGWKRGRASAVRRTGPLALLFLVVQLLLALGLPAAAAPPLLDRFGNPICTSGSGHEASDANGSPHADAARCCAALCFAAAAAAPPPAAVSLVRSRAPVSSAVVPAAFGIVRTPLDDSPRLTRGPPPSPRA